MQLTLKENLVGNSHRADIGRITSFWDNPETLAGNSWLRMVSSKVAIFIVGIKRKKNRLCSRYTYCCDAVAS